MFLFLLSAALLLAFLLPWKSWAALLLQQELSKRGISVEAMNVTGIAYDGLRFEQVKLVAPVTVEVLKLSLKLSWEALRQRRWAEAVSAVSFEGVSLVWEKNDKGLWMLNGQPLPQGNQPEEKTAPETAQRALDAALSRFALFPAIDAKTIDVTVKEAGQTFHTQLEAHSERLLNGVHLAVSAEQPSLTIEGQGALSLPHFTGEVRYEGHEAGPTMHVALSFPATQWQGPAFNSRFDGAAQFDVVGEEKPRLQLALKQLQAEQGALKASLPALDFTATGGGASSKAAREWFPWALQIKADSIALEGLPAPVAQLALDAGCMAAETKLDCATLHISTPTKNIALGGAMHLAYDAPTQLGWNMNGQMKDLLGGQASFTAEPLNGRGLQPLKLVLKLDKLGLEPVLSLLAEGKVKAQGSVSGMVPVVWRGGQNVEFGAGELKADAPGTIQLAPELLAMNNPQVAMVSGILADFHFTELKIILGQGAKGGLKAGLSTLGNNPTQLDGRSVKLNVNLSGDLLSLLQQSILPMSDPQQWLKNQQESSSH